MGVRARPSWALALLLLCAACKTADDGPAVGTPGLEPPKMASDAGVVQPRPSEDGEGPGRTPPPPAVTPGDSMGGFANAGTTASGGAGGGFGASGAGGSASTPVTNAPDGGLDGGLDAGSGPGDALFEGLWVIDQPSHALYEATLYELSPGGELDALDTMRFSAEPWPGYVTGTVENTDRSVRCQFAGQWRSLAPRTVELDATCTDGTPRSIQLSLPEGQDVSTGVMPLVLPVEGESGWDHRDWPWSWRKCESRADCSPF